jgi:hypothetical protein
MKKLFIGLVMLSVSGSIIAQEAADKDVQAGLIVGYGMNFQNMGTKKIAANGVGSDLTVGTNVNFSFNETIGLCTGLEFDFETLKYKANENIYYNYNDADIQTNEETVGDANQLFRLDTRTQKPVYLTIPTMLLFRTKFIGYFRYFGKFGLRNSFLLNNKINDTGDNYELDINPVAEELLGTTTAGTNENMVAKNEMFFFKSAFGLCGGAEWNFTGATSLIAEVGYYYGFTPLHNDRKDEKSYLYTVDALGTEKSYFSNQANQGQLMFKLSILF